MIIYNVWLFYYTIIMCFLFLCDFRWILLVDDPSCLQAEVRGREGPGGRRSHPGQRGLREISGQ